MQCGKRGGTVGSRSMEGEGRKGTTQGESHEVACLLTDDWACVMLLLTLCMASSCSLWISAKDLALVATGRLERKVERGWVSKKKTKWCPTG